MLNIESCCCHPEYPFEPMVDKVDESDDLVDGKVNTGGTWDM